MKYFVEFYQICKWGKNEGKLIPGCGTDSVLPLDGRLSLNHMYDAAVSRYNKIRNVNDFAAFKITCGESLLQTRDLTEFINL